MCDTEGIARGAGLRPGVYAGAVGHVQHWGCLWLWRRTGAGLESLHKNTCTHITLSVHAGLPSRCVLR
jgi:hypothetical protein